MKKTLIITAVLTATSTLTLQAQSLLITEVYSAGSGNGTYAAAGDWLLSSTFHPVISIGEALKFVTSNQSAA